MRSLGHNTSLVVFNASSLRIDIPSLAFDAGKPGANIRVVALDTRSPGDNVTRVPCALRRRWLT